MTYIRLSISAQKIKVVCYFTNWATHRPPPADFHPGNIDAKFCTHVVYAFAELDSDKLIVKPQDVTIDINRGILKVLKQY